MKSSRAIIKKNLLFQEQIPGYPFQIVAINLFEYAGRDYVAMIDAYSNYVSAERLNNKTSGHIIDVICRLFDRVGYPTILKCDNSPFGSAEFDRFAAACNIRMKFSSSQYPQSNGLAEKGVAIVKNILKRCYEVDEADQFQYRFLEYNTTPVASMQLTPSELFFGRLIKTKIPVSDSLLVRNNLREENIQEKIKEKREKQKFYYNRNARSLPVLNMDDLVIFKKNGREWNYGKIAGKVNDRSYIVRDQFNNFFRRRFIAKTKNVEYGASELLFEENIGVSSRNVMDNLKEIQIVPPHGRTNDDNNDNETHVAEKLHFQKKLSTEAPLEMTV